MFTTCILEILKETPWADPFKVFLVVDLTLAALVLAVAAEKTKWPIVPREGRNPTWRQGQEVHSSSCVGPLGIPGLPQGVVAAAGAVVRGCLAAVAAAGELTTDTAPSSLPASMRELVVVRSGEAS